MIVQKNKAKYGMNSSFTHGIRTLHCDPDGNNTNTWLVCNVIKIQNFKKSGDSQRQMNL